MPQSNLKSYMNEVEKVVEPVEPPIILHAEPIIEKVLPDPPDVPDDPPVIVEKRAPRVKPTVTRQPRVVEPLQEEIIKPEPISEAREVFYQHLLEKMDHLNDVRPISVVVETTESHIERLLKIEQSMVEMTTQCVASVKQKLQEEVVANREMINNLVVNRDTIDVMVNAQQKIVETQNAMISVITALSVKIAAISTNQPAAPVVNVPAPIINIPAPIVNITENGRRTTTKLVERDAKGMITKVIEDSSADDV